MERKEKIRIIRQMSGSHIPLSSKIKLVATASPNIQPTAAVEGTSGSIIVSTESATTVTLTNTTSATPRMLVPAVLIPNDHLGSHYTQFIPTANPKGQSVGSPSTYQPLIISGMSSQSPSSSSVFSLLKPVITQVKDKPSPKSGPPTVLQNTKHIGSPQTSTVLQFPQTQKFKLLAKGPSQERSTAGTAAPPPLQPLATPTFINFNKHISGLNQFKRIQPFPLESNDSILKVRLKQGHVMQIEGAGQQSTRCIDLEEVETTPTVEPVTKPPAAEPTHTVTVAEGQQPDFININFMRMKDYINEFPQLITIHGLTSEKPLSESEPETETAESTTETLVDEPPVSSPGVVEEPPAETVETSNASTKIEESDPEPAPESMEVQQSVAENVAPTPPEVSKPEESVAETTEKPMEEKTESSKESEISEKTEEESAAADTAAQLEKLEEELLNLKKKPRQFKRPSILGSRKKSMPPTNTLLTKKAGESDDKEKSADDGTSKSSGEAKPTTDSKESKVDSLEMPPIDEKSMKPVSKDFDPSKLLDWQDGVGVLPGSDLKFKMNDLGILEYINADDGENDDSSQKEPPVVAKKEEKKIETKKRARKEKLSPDDIYCCENCGCYGMACEFKSQRFCSETCEEVAAKRRAAISRRAIELEEMKLKRKRRRQMLELQHQKEKEAALLQKAQLEDSMDDKSTSTGTPEVPQLPSSQPESSMDHQEAAPDTPADTGTPMSTAHNTPLPSPEPSDNEQEQEEEENKRCESPPAPLLPWQFTNSDKRVQFSWPKYLEHLKARAAPTKLFLDHGFPYQRNGFRPGMRLEGIDPRMPSQFCSYSVATIRGYRMKLHYEGWPDSHDFWVNADSRDIFLIGFCEKTSRPLIPPRGYPKTTFNWASYLKLLHANSAPRQLFLHRSSSKISVGPSGFRVGMKLEAVDKHNPNLICVATVADILDGRILVHFDSWDRTYDYWAEPSSPYIHPVGWCEQNGRTLTPPNGYTTFDWDSYLKETKSTAVPSRAFKPKPPPGFKKGMKLECVDPRFPEIIRVSTVNDVKEHRVQVSFDGWPLETAVWVDADSPDIHPMGWCNKTGHPLTPPPGPNQEHPCMTSGCRALLKNSQFILPHSSGTCPLATVNLNKAKKGSAPTLPFYFSSKEETLKIRSESSEREEWNERFEKSESPVAKRRKIESAPPTDKALKTLRTDVHESVFNPGYSPSPVEPQVNWTKHAELLNIDTQKLQNQKPVRAWSPSHVEQFVQSLPGCSDRSKIFLQEKIDGQALLMLSQSDLINMLGFKVGPAIKLYSSISILRQAQTTS